MQTRVYRIDRADPDRNAIAEVAAALRAGAVVAFPTELGTAVACRIQDAARLEPVCRQTAVCIARREDVRSYVPHLIWPVRKLINACWPGPLTILFEISKQDLEDQRIKLDQEQMSRLYRDSTVGVICPDDELARELITTAAVPILGCIIDASDTAGADIVIDVEPPPAKKDATIIKTSKTGLKVLKEGFFSEESLRRAMKVEVVFVCAGNTCRSPMAEGLFRKYLAQKLDINVDRLEQMGYKISSAGLIAVPGLAASPESVAFCSSNGVDISGHRSRVVDSDIVDGGDLIFVMSRAQKNRILSKWPQAAAKIMLLCEMQDIPDPIGGSRQNYVACGEMIESSLRKILSELLI